jgi:hypothetical protein
MFGGMAEAIQARTSRRNASCSAVNDNSIERLPSQVPGAI